MEFYRTAPTHDLTYSDVFLVPSRSGIRSRLDVSLAPDDGSGGSIPLVSANMNSVTGKRMAEAMARSGGLGVLPQDMRLDTVARIVRHIQACDPRYDTPLAVSRTATLRDVEGIIRKRDHGMVIVTEEERPIGLVTLGDL